MGNTSEGPARRYRICISRKQGFHFLPGDYGDPEQAKKVFEKHHGEVRWCLIAEIEPNTERPIYVFHGEAGGPLVEWRSVS